ncbi:hypothetical protein TRICI_001896 [Trichomonascus ciferrii]|uniref:Amino acid permease/ SLC12A domain-containing protein n=1 Tax=Trichomonascus ciferrii TaxID=44093 RepID=A0A642V8E2_9ASCO|nr:hypothetical protein TRICI_001896 [Trichomonascus ciferrii]
MDVERRESKTSSVPVEGIEGNNQLGTVVSVVDDAASSICIDDYDADYRNAVSVLRQTNRTAGEAEEEMTDFDRYNQRVAREVVLRERTQRRRQVQNQRQKRQASRQYSNYFNDVVSATGSNFFTPSHNLDNFNGRRQNLNYNHQLNQINNPFTYDGRQRGANNGVPLERIDEGTPPVHEDNDVPVRGSDEMSFVTMDVDMLESADEDDDSQLLRSATASDNEDEDHKPKLKRKLYSRHVQVMSLGCAYGVGVLLTCGESLYISGPFGTVLGYSLAGLLVLSATSGFGEMAALVPSESGVPGLTARFVDGSLGFALGITYWVACSLALATEITAAALMLTYYPTLASPPHSVVVWIIFFLVIVLVINLCQVDIFGELQFYGCLITILLVILYIILMFTLNGGGLFGDAEESSIYKTSGGRIGFRYWDYSKSDFKNDVIFGLFRPGYTLGIIEGTTRTTYNSVNGSAGNFLQLWFAINIAAFSYVGTEVVYMTSGEVRNPRKSLPAATKKIFFRVLIFYVLAVFSVSLNIYSSDGRLVPLTSRYIAVHKGNSTSPNSRIDGTYQNSTGPSAYKYDPGGCVVGHVPWYIFTNNSNSSPWIIALQSVGQCALAAGVNGTFVFIALMAATSHLYAASRTLYGMGLEGMIFNKFSSCTRTGVPYFSVLTSFAIALLSLLTANEQSAIVFQWLSSLTASAGLLVWAGMCLSFIRFYKGLQLRPDITTNRGKDDLYPYKSPFQPYLAYIGCSANTILALVVGFPFLLSSEWDWKEVFANYTSHFILIIAYVAHKSITKCKLVPYNQMDLDSGRKEMERVGWAEDRVYKKGLRERFWDLFFKLKKKAK